MDVGAGERQRRRLAGLYKKRVELLEGRGLVFSFSDLFSLYRGELEVE